ncbi:aldo/keto reductase [Tatumella ptyseos]|uniref:aldo/keto reductase n=1 Tax=Tatumella ptyseos TaxID=82987 RepID=UPI0026EE8787|nr:aldo/keto reductase [Tatumella ptyseos]WKX27936.1 aldo/keto reductase [Tatumella ptyseos]
MLTTELSNGIAMPRLGFGVFQIPDLNLCEEAVISALTCGYRLLDTASAYENEAAVGRAILRSGVARKEIFLTTKLWVQDYGYESTKEAFYRSLERLQTDYLDLYLIHQPYSDIHGSWRAMEDLYREGVIKAIGVSNFSSAQLADLITFNHIAPMVNQVETHPFCQQNHAAEFMQQHHIAIEAWAPFAEGKNEIFTQPLLTTIAQRHQKTVAQVILRWLLQRNIVVIPKSVNPQRIAENFAVFDFSLTEQDMKEISTLDLGKPLIANHADPERIKFIGTRRFAT